MINYYENIEYVDIPLLQRFGYYVQAAVRQGAFHQFSTIFDRFQNAVGIAVGSRQRERYRSGIQAIAKTFNLDCFYTFGSRGRALCITCKESSYFNPLYNGKNVMADILLEALHKSSAGLVKVYDTLKKATKASQAGLERQVKEYKEKAKVLGLEFFKRGRELCVQLRYPTIINCNISNTNRANSFTKNTPQNPDITYYIKAKEKEILRRNTAKAGIRFTSSMNKKALWLAHELTSLDYFYDNCKVMLNMGMLICFTRWAIRQGFEETMIRSKFRQALIQCHRDATDYGLSQQLYGYKYAMSSTVSLAKKLLIKHGKKTHLSRWEDLKQRVFPKRKEEALKKPAQPPAKKMKKATFDDIINSALRIAFKSK